MVEGKMRVESAEIAGGVEILNRSDYEGVPMTLDSEVFQDKDVIKAGSLITDEAKIAEAGAKAAGILLFDVYKGRPQGTILKKAYVNIKRIKESLGEDYETQYGSDDLATVKGLLPMIVFEEIPGE